MLKCERLLRLMGADVKVPSLNNPFRFNFMKTSPQQQWSGQRAKPELAIGSKTALGIQWLVITSLGMSGFDLPVRVHLQLIAAPSTGGFSMGGSGSADFAAPLSTGRFEETQSGCNPGDER